MGWLRSLANDAHARWAVRVLLTSVAAVIVHRATFQMVRRLTRRRRWTSLLLDRARWPARVLVVVIAAFTTLPASQLSMHERGVVAHALLLAGIAAGAWLLISVTAVGEQALRGRYALDVGDNLQARRVQTQVGVLRRIIVIAIGLVAAAAMLLTFDRARALGTSMLASAGVAGLVAGVAGRSSIANLVAGVQIALTEPIRLDDVVVVENEWGRIEELTLSYVVVCLWDRRRLVLPISYFVENPFQNWTRRSADILGAVTLKLDFTTDVDALRDEFHRALRASPRWNRDVAVVQVTDADDRGIEVRLLMSARDAPTAFDLRCDMREHIIEYLRDEQPWALPRGRDELLRESSPALEVAAGR